MTTTPLCAETEAAIATFPDDHLLPISAGQLRALIREVDSGIQIELDEWMAAVADAPPCIECERLEQENALLKARRSDLQVRVEEAIAVLRRRGDGAESAPMRTTDEPASWTDPADESR